MTAGDTHVDGIDDDAGNDFGLFHGFPDRRDGIFNVDDNALAKAARQAGPYANDIRPAVLS